MQAVKRLWGQISLSAALALGVSLMAIGTAVWTAASSSGAKDQRLLVLEGRMERMETAFERLVERLPPPNGIRPAGGKR